MKLDRTGSQAAADIRSLEVETPEHVVLAYELADLGSRFLALVLDGLILAGGWLLVALATVGVARLLGTRSAAGDVWLAIGLTFMSLSFLGYFILFEGLREGQTPGKKRVGIRVVHDGGFPITFRGAAIRNFVRLIDVQPAGTCAIAGLAMMLHPSTKRLGDMAAGTLVVRDRGDGTLPEDAWGPATALGHPRLTDTEFAALDQFMARRDAIMPEARARVAEKLRGALADRVPPAGEKPLPLEERLAELHADETARRTATGALPGRGSRQAAELVRQQRARWEEYSELLERARDQGLSSLPEHEVSRFAALYRLLAADLARARTYGGSGELVYTLERRVGAGHNLLYRPGAQSWSELRDWLTGGFPALVRRNWRATALAAALFYLPAGVTYYAVWHDPQVARALLPAEFIVRAEEAPGRLAAGKRYVDIPQHRMASTSAMIFTNNIKVTFLAFAGGVLAGLGTVLALVFNGIAIGASLALYDKLGAGSLIWTFIVGHGVIELTSICIAGGAGLLLGLALLAPGRRTRGRALAEAARDAVPLLLGTTAMLLVAGLIEGFVSPAAIPVAAKLTVSGLSALATAAYLLGAGRNSRTRQKEAARRLQAAGSSQAE